MIEGLDTAYTPPRAVIDPDSSKGWFRRLLPLLLAYKGLMAVVVPAAILSAGAGVAIPWYVKGAVDVTLDQQAEPLAPYLWTLAGLALATGVFGGIQMYSMRKLVQSLEYELRATIYQHLTRLSFSFYDKVQTGQLISRANSDIRATLMFLGMVPMLATSVLTFVIALGLMIYVHATLALLAVATLPGVYFVSARMRSALFPISWLIQARMADLATIVEENVTGARVVKSFASEGHQIGLLARSAERLRKSSLPPGANPGSDGSLARELTSHRSCGRADLRGLVGNRRVDHHCDPAALQFVHPAPAGAVSHPGIHPDHGAARRGVGRTSL